MALLQSLSLRARLLASSPRRPALQAAVTYLVVAPLAQVLSSWVGSLSEYRFPHPLLTTTLHLLISLITLSLLTLLSPILLRHHRRSASPTSLFRLPNPLTLFSTLSAILASLLELHSTKTTETSFWSFIRLLPLIVVVLIPSSTRANNVTLTTRVVGGIVWVILVGGPGVGLGSSVEGLVTGIAYAVCLVQWVRMTKVGLREGEKEGEVGARSQPTVFLHLILSTLFLLPPLLYSNEITSAIKSGHFGFFTEVGFWLQEIVMALCGLATLCSFWSLLRHNNIITIFLLLSLKDFLLPFLFSWIFDNLLRDDYLATGKSALKVVHQVFGLIAVGAYVLADEWPTMGGVGGLGTRDKMG